LPNVSNISGGKLAHVDNFDAKAEVEDYIRTLSIKSSFFSPGSFMQNFISGYEPQPAEDGTYFIATCVSPLTQLPLLDPASGTGAYVGAIIADPERLEGRILSAGPKLYSFEDVAQAISKASGKTVKYIQVSEKVYRSYLPAKFGDTLVEMLLYYQDYGYFGPDMKERITWSAQWVKGHLTSLEEFLEENPLPSLEE
jgi:uncharacterized protein YbjT (DUF2867 family)